MQAFDIKMLESQRQQSGRSYLEFLRVSALSLGIYTLKAGHADPQQPHTEDEVYYVHSGRGRFRVGENDVTVGPGSVLFVERLVEHRFHDIAEDMTILVFFAPAEYSQRDGAIAGHA
jgi:mannose-6-phosphate isomerase-like protein (cupin superfamily)